jgi:hypothetical protein
MSGTSRFIRHCDELSITMAPFATIFGDHSFDTADPADIRHNCVPEKSK